MHESIAKLLKPFFKYSKNTLFRNIFFSFYVHFACVLNNVIDDNGIHAILVIQVLCKWNDNETVHHIAENKFTFIRTNAHHESQM
jgi:hypothetical protein